MAEFKSEDYRDGFHEGMVVGYLRAVDLARIMRQAVMADYEVLPERESVLAEDLLSRADVLEAYVTALERDVRQLNAEIRTRINEKG